MGPLMKEIHDAMRNLDEPGAPVLKGDVFPKPRKGKKRKKYPVNYGSLRRSKRVRSNLEKHVEQD